jgi:predicted CoA-binding protein
MARLLLPLARSAMQHRGFMTTRVEFKGVHHGAVFQRCFSSEASPKEVDPEPLKYDDSYIKAVLAEARTIAMVGASPHWNRPSFFAMKYLQAKGYRVIPVNPAAVGKHILGELVYGDLKSVPVPIDMVDIFRNSEAAGPITDEAITIGAKIVWMQLGVVNAAAAARAEAAGLKVVQDRCPKIEFSRLFGELGWHGFNSGVISSKRRPVGVATKGAAAADPAAAAAGEAAADAKPKLPDIVFRGFETRSIHAGASPDPTTGARSTPIFQTTAYGPLPAPPHPPAPPRPLAAPPLRRSRRTPLPPPLSLAPAAPAPAAAE